MIGHDQSSMTMHCYRTNGLRIDGSREMESQEKMAIGQAEAEIHHAGSSDNFHLCTVTIAKI